MLTNPNDIQSHLEELSKQEEVRGAKLQSRLTELTEQLSSQNISTGTSTEVKFGTEVKLHIGTTKFDKVLKTKSKIDDLIQLAKVSIATEHVGFREDQGKIVWVRTDQDLTFMFKWYFAQELPFIQIVGIPAEYLPLIKKVNLQKIVSSPKGDCAVFLCEFAGDGPLIFLPIPNSNKQDGFAYLTSIFGQFQSLMFYDESEDIITVDSDESWEYCLETGIAMSKIGKFPILLLEMQN